MTTYVFVEMRCPNCGATGSTVQCSSTSGFGAKYYTDGCMEGGGYDPGVSLLRCRSCDEYCWWDEAETLAISDLPLGDDKSGDLFTPVRKEAWLAALEAEAWRTPVQERMVRQSAWWAHNARYRQDPQPAFQVDEAAQANAGRLLELLGQEQGDELLKAEVLRYLGRMDECLRQLETITDPDHAEPAALIRRLARQGKRQVAEVV